MIKNNIETVTITDNKMHIPQESFSNITELILKIENRNIKSLQENDAFFIYPRDYSDIEDIDKSHFIISKDKNEYSTGNLMGFLGYKKERLNICSRFDYLEDGKEANNHLLKYMLFKVFDIPNIINLNTDSDNNNQLYDLLDFLFPNFLKTAMRKGIYKTYVNNKYNDYDVKGTIDIARHIKINTPFLGKVAYNQREFSYDNYLTQLVRHTIEYLNSKYSKDFFFNCKDEISTIKEVSKTYSRNNLKKVLNENQKKPVTNRYYYEYRQLQKLCLMILRREKINPGQGDNEVYGVLFDGSWLWEEYVDTIIGERSNEQQRLFYHSKNKANNKERKRYPQQLFYEEIDNKKQGLIYPDFVGNNMDNRMVADAKYKPIENIKTDDYKEILTYMFRFEAKKGLFFYPDNKEADYKKLHLLKGYKPFENEEKREDTWIEKVGIKIPNNESFNEFVTEMERSEKMFLERICNLLNSKEI